MLRSVFLQIITLKEVSVVGKRYSNLINNYCCDVTVWTVKNHFRFIQGDSELL